MIFCNILADATIDEDPTRLLVVVGTLRDVFRVLASQGGGAEYSGVSTPDETRLSPDAGDVSAAVPGRVSWEGFELGSEALRVSGALETDDLFWDACLEEIWPVASVDPLIVDQARGAGLVQGLPEGALGVEGLARAWGVDAEVVLADSTLCGQQLKLASLAVDAPVIVAIVVHSALAVKQQAVLTGLQRQGAVGTLVELVAGIGMGVQL